MKELNLVWGKPWPITVAGQPRMIRSAKETPEFWEAYTTNPLMFEEQGIRPGKKSSKLVYQLMPLPDEATGRHAHPTKHFLIQKLRSHQYGAVKQLAAQFAFNDGQLDASSMGTGKTYVALGVCKLMGWRPFVVCRKSGIPEWEAAAKHLEVEAEVLNYESVKRGGKGRGGEWVEEVTKKGKSITKFVWKKDHDIVIFDEIHACRHNSINAQLVVQAKAQGFKILGLSATPASSPMQMRAIGYAIGLHDLDNYWPWLMRHGCCKPEDSYGFEFWCGMTAADIYDKPAGQKILATKRREVMAKLHKKIFLGGLGIKIDSANLPGFPVNTIIPVALDFSDKGKINTAFQVLRSEIERIRKRSETDKESALVAMLRAWQEIEMIKVPVMVEEAKNAIEEGYSVAIFVNYTETREALAKLLETDCMVFGGQTTEERHKCVSDFQENLSPKIILNITAGCESLSIQDVYGGHPRLSLISPTFKAEPLIQASGRTARQGGKTPCITKILFSAGTLEERAYLNCKAAANNITSLTDGDLVAGILT